jgi:hypothetical protein
MGDKPFWSIIESAWEAVGGKVEDRRTLAEGRLSEEKVERLCASLGKVIAALYEQLDQLSAEDLLAFDRILEQKLYDIDRRDVQEYTGGSHDEFLDARGFVVAAGKRYYEAVNANPATAVSGLECQEICYLSWVLYQEKFAIIPDGGISRETGSNHAGWESLG